MITNNRRDNKQCLPHIEIIQDILLNDEFDDKKEVIGNELVTIQRLLSDETSEKLLSNLNNTMANLNTNQSAFALYFNYLTLSVLGTSMMDKRGYEYLSKHEELDEEQIAYFEICDKYDELCARWIEMRMRHSEK